MAPFKPALYAHLVGPCQVEPDRKFLGSISGLLVFSDPGISPGTVVLRDAAGKTIGTIFNVAEVCCGKAE